MDEGVNFKESMMDGCAKILDPFVAVSLSH